MSATTTNNALITKIFNNVEEMRTSTDLTVGTVCRTLGYYEKNDGGGASYIIEAIGNETANGMDIISIGGDNSPSLIARFSDEGKPVNVLQFGAHNNYKYYPNRIAPSDRNDSIAIQRAIDYTDEKLFNNYTKTGSEINSVIIPGGTYVIADQIVLPPYMQMYLDGDVQFFSYITADEQLYKYSDLSMPSLEGWSTPQYGGDTNNDMIVATKDNKQIAIYKRKTDEKIVRIRMRTSTVNEGGETKDVLEEIHLANMDEIDNATESEDFPIICAQKEVFAKNDIRFMNGNGQEVVLENNYNGEEYHVYKKGIIKICEKYVTDGKRRDPYMLDAETNRTAILPHINSEVFCGDGSLIIHNKIFGDDNTIPPYVCGIEIGDYSEYIRFMSKNSPEYDEKQNKGPHYENLRFSKLKIYNCHVGILSRAMCFYSNVISDTEFFQNKIGFQFGVYGENDKIKYTNTYEDVPINVNALDSYAHTTVTDGISGEGAYRCGEMNHFRDCLFTGNKISVNILMSSFSATFTSCHFDFENCIFRAAYRTNLTMDKCHIEGTGKALGAKYFPLNEEITDVSFAAFENRAQIDPMDEFVGIMYAKPLTKFYGNSVVQHSYVDLNIESSRIIDAVILPWPMFSYYNDTTGEMVSDGHHRSNLHLNNNTYSFGDSRPTCFLSSDKNGIVSSGFLLSEYPERELGEGVIGTEKDAVQNIPVTCRDTNEWQSYVNCDDPRGNHRFLSNRTLANNYPYFQNVEVISGMTIKKEAGDNYDVRVSPTDSSNNPFNNFDTNAKVIGIQDVYHHTNDPENETIEQPIVTLSFDNDLIECTKGDVLSAALVTNVISCNSRVVFEGGNVTSQSTETFETVGHKIRFVELDKNGDPITKMGTFEYDVKHMGDSEIWNYNYENFPCTTACMHRVRNKETHFVKIVVDFSRTITYSNVEVPSSTYTNLCAVLVDKNK